MSAKLQFRRGLAEKEIACAPLLTIGRSPPNELAALMAKWFKMATKAIAECHGTIGKFIGDAILVRWVSGIGKSEPISVWAIRFGELDAVLSKAAEENNGLGRE